LPVVYEIDSCPGPIVLDHPRCVAFCRVGPGYFEGPKKVLGGSTHLLFMIDMFTKRIETRTLAKIVSNQAVSYVQDIIFYFGVPNSIITDNGTRFTEEKFLDLYYYNNIRVNWAAVAHLCTNEQVEGANGLIL
jgi:hypothetical protein